MGKILIICNNYLNRDPRVLVQYDALRANHDIALGGFSAIEENENIEFVKIDKPERSKIEKVIMIFSIMIGVIEPAYWFSSNRRNFVRLNKVKKIDLIISNDLDTLPIAVKLKKNRRANLIFDAHEYYPDSGQSKGIRKFLKRRYNHLLAKKYLRSADSMVTVAPSIADLYQINYNVSPKIVMNLPSLISLNPSEVDPNDIRIVHHGAALPNRKIELMIEMMKYLDEKYSLTFYLVTSNSWKGYYESLKRLAKDINKRIFFKDPVDTKFIPNELNNYDIGLFILPPVNVNYRFALPNKLFEFVQARLAILIGPSVEMKNIVNKFGLGIVSENFDPRSVADSMKVLDVSKIMEFKKNCNTASLGLNSGVSKAKWLDIAGKLLSGNS